VLHTKPYFCSAHETKSKCGVCCTQSHHFRMSSRQKTLCIDNMYFRILMELSVHSFSVSKKNVYSHSPKFKNINMHGALMSCIAISTIDFACTRARALFLWRDAEAKYMLQSIFYILY